MGLCCLVFTMGLAAVGVTGCAQSGESLYKSKCGTCHSLSTVENSSYVNSGQWSDEVKRMQKQSTTISDSDASAITAYLEKTYPGK